MKNQALQPQSPVAVRGLLKRRQVIDLIGISMRTFERWVATKAFPKADIRLGRVLLWKTSTVAAWIEAEARKNRRAA